MTNEEAKQAIRTLTAFFDEYNETGFLTETNKIVLGSHRDAAHKALRIIQFLKEKEPNSEAVLSYETFCRKLMLRFYYLINEGRKETDKERNEWFSS